MNKKHAILILVLNIFFLFNCKNEGKKDNIESPKKDNWVKLFNGKDAEINSVWINSSPKRITGPSSDIFLIDAYHKFYRYASKWDLM